jgi:signal transduction histidine kinase
MGREMTPSSDREVESRDRLVAEQAALRRVATLVAEGATAAELFNAVATEVAAIIDPDAVLVSRFGAGPTFTVVASALKDQLLDIFPVGSTWPLDGPGVSAEVFATGQPARVDDYSQIPGTVASRIRSSVGRSSVGVPIVVDGTVWGVIAVGTTNSEPLPTTTESHLGDFTELLATAISNTQARVDLRRIADEQAALRHIATLVAEGAEPQAIFAAVCKEASLLFGASIAALARFTPDGMNESVAATNLREQRIIPAGTRIPLDGQSVNALIKNTGAPARIDNYDDATGPLAEVLRELGIKSGVGAPVVVDGELWGALILSSDTAEEFPAETEFRLASFAELVATAISNSAHRAELLASRARIVAAGDEARRKIERNLHDGTQQRLIALGLDLQRIRATIPDDQATQHSDLARVEHDLESVLQDVREVSRGLHPALLSRAGLSPALRALARTSPIPVDIEIDLDRRPPAQIETAVYYVAAEALTNAIKHSQANVISITIANDSAATVTTSAGESPAPSLLHATIADDGIGGAHLRDGSGLIGAIDRIDALGGRLTLESPADQGTVIAIELPIADQEEG